MIKTPKNITKQYSLQKDQFNKLFPNAESTKVRSDLMSNITIEFKGLNNYIVYRTIMAYTKFGSSQLAELNLETTEVNKDLIQITLIAKVIGLRFTQWVLSIFTLLFTVNAIYRIAINDNIERFNLLIPGALTLILAIFVHKIYWNSGKNLISSFESYIGEKND